MIVREQTCRLWGGCQLGLKQQLGDCFALLSLVDPGQPFLLLLVVSLPCYQVSLLLSALLQLLLIMILLYLTAVVCKQHVQSVITRLRIGRCNPSVLAHHDASVPTVLFACLHKATKHMLNSLWHMSTAHLALCCKYLWMK